METGPAVLEREAAAGITHFDHFDGFGHQVVTLRDVAQLVADQYLICNFGFAAEPDRLVMVGASSFQLGA